MVAWCHGAAGIGLTRIGASHVVPPGDDLELAIRAVRSTGLHPVDHLCCGNAARIELLLDASLAGSRPDLLDDARRRAVAMVDRAAARGRFTLTSDAGDELIRPGFFRGLAGIGYTLLRAFDPSRLPSIARFDLPTEDNA